MALFTVILDYQKGTYISQVRAKGAWEALKTWADTLDTGEIPGVGERGKRRIAASVREEGCRPIPLEGLANVWCAGMVLMGGLVNIVKTVQQSRPAHTEAGTE